MIKGISTTRSLKSASAKSFVDENEFVDVDPYRFKRTRFLVEIRISLLINSLFACKKFDYIAFYPMFREFSIYGVESGNAKTTTVDLRRMMENGMNVCVLKSEFFTEDGKRKMFRKLNKAASQMAAKYGIEWPIMIGCTLKTAQATSGLLADEKDLIILKQDHEVILTNNMTYYNNCTPDVLFVDNPQLTKESKVGMEITFNDGKCVMECIEILDKKSIKCVVTVAGQLTHMEPVFFRECTFLRTDINESDIRIINFCIEHPVDSIIIYYANARTMKKVHPYFDAVPSRKKPFIFAAICEEQGLHDLDEIMPLCDAIMICRGFMEHELSKKAQKRIIAIQQYVCGKCLEAGKPIYISGGVLTNLADNNILLHSEIMGVKSVLTLGVSGLVLRCRLEAKLLIEALGILKNLCRNLEPQVDVTIYESILNKVNVPLNAAEAAVIACIAVARQTSADLIVVPTVTGQTARALSRFYPPCFSIAVCTSMQVAKTLAAIKSVFPILFSVDMTGNKFEEIVLARIQFAVDYAVRMRWIDIDKMYVTLQRSNDTCSYCDLVEVWNETSNSIQECPESGSEWP